MRGLLLDRGIVIPGLAVDGRLWYLKVRRPLGEPRYKHVLGSRSALVGRLTDKAALLLCEGEFDAMLAWQEAGDLVDVATFGGCTADPSPWLAHLLPYRSILVAYDMDAEGENKAHQRWDWTARSTRAYLPLSATTGPEGKPANKDITDFWKSGGDLRTWASYYWPTGDDPLVARLTAGEALLRQREVVGDRGLGYQRLLGEWLGLLAEYEQREG